MKRRKWWTIALSLTLLAACVGVVTSRQNSSPAFFKSATTVKALSRRISEYSFRSSFREVLQDAKQELAPEHGWLVDPGNEACFTSATLKVSITDGSADAFLFGGAMSGDPSRPAVVQVQRTTISPIERTLVACGIYAKEPAWSPLAKDD